MNARYNTVAMKRKPPPPRATPPSETQGQTDEKIIMWGPLMTTVGIVNSMEDMVLVYSYTPFGKRNRQLTPPKTFLPRTLNPSKHNNKPTTTTTVRSSLQWNRKPQLSGDTPRVVVITSGKGGVGKTTTTANVGLSLARLGFSVVAVDADVGLRNLDLLLGLENRVNYTAVEALTWLVDALKSRSDGRPPPDFVIIDCPAGIDAGFVTAIAPANEAVLVTTPDITSLRDADRVTGLLECDGIRDIKMVVNRVRTDMIKGEDMMSVLDVQEMLGLALLGAAWRLVENDSMKAVAVEEMEPKRWGWFSFFGR
ncbi:hypothetical protein QJS10_CPB15g00763 [Acorus calamus]|uniref:CobQ/CobB/MinD/ParA nucleotide binding domain-containing protein n=1 Tax=Acorus calamus TaxID=4465 RepID=A0AAV9D9Y6_ACOCL|nr:hypothetical protein QJS10_CPB15g00763 [Acorus calamus]